MAADETRVDAADVLADWCWRNGFGNTDGHKAAAILAALREAAGGGGYWTAPDGVLSVADATHVDEHGEVWVRLTPVVGP